jgi:hypothetical protein
VHVVKEATDGVHTEVVDGEDAAEPAEEVFCGRDRRRGALQVTCQCLCLRLCSEGEKVEELLVLSRVVQPQELQSGRELPLLDEQDCLHGILAGSRVLETVHVAQLPERVDLALRSLELPPVRLPLGVQAEVDEGVEDLPVAKPLIDES